MAKFFIDRPVFAWVIALFIVLAGLLCMRTLPISQYPTIAPPSIVINATYPGASAAILDDSVTSLIEQELNGADGLQYIESQSQSNGTTAVTATFLPGTNPDLAAVDVQNRMKRVEPRLPDSVRQQGVQVTKSRANFLLFTTLSSTDGRLDPVALGDYLSRNVLNEIRRVPGVGQAQLFGTERAMRIWIDPAKLVGFKLSTADVIDRDPQPECAGRVRHAGRPAQPGQPADLGPGRRQRPADVGRAVRQDRAARQSGRLDRAPVRRRPHRDRRPGLCDRRPAGRQAHRGHRRAAVADRERAADRRAGEGQDGRAVEVLPAGREV